MVSKVKVHLSSIQKTLHPEDGSTIKKETHFITRKKRIKLETWFSFLMFLGFAGSIDNPRIQSIAQDEPKHKTRLTEYRSKICHLH